MLYLFGRDRGPRSAWLCRPGKDRDHDHPWTRVLTSWGQQAAGHRDRGRLADPHRPVALVAARLGDRAVAISKRRSLYLPNGNPAPGPLNSRYFRPVRGKETRARRWDLQFESTSLQRGVRSEPDSLQDQRKPGKAPIAAETTARVVTPICIGDGIATAH